MSLKKILMERDSLSSEEVDNLISEAREDLMERLEEGEFVDDVDFCLEWFQLEPDYLMELI